MISETRSKRVMKPPPGFLETLILRETTCKKVNYAETAILERSYIGTTVDNFR